MRFPTLVIPALLLLSQISVAATDGVAAKLGAREITLKEIDTLGGTSVYEASPLQRRLRDIHALTQHIGVSRDAFGFVGTLLAGEELDPRRPI